jgi:CheY-like chemotaxis protein
MIGNLLTFRRSAAPADRTAIAAPAAGQQTILIVDGRPDSLRAMCLALSGESYRLETADTARAALRKIWAGLPDLILLDSRVLAADGARLANRLLADEDLASVPIVALTETVTSPEGIHWPRGAYDGHIQKPIDAGTFDSQIRGFLQSREAACPAVHLDLPSNIAVIRRTELAKLLEAIEAGLPDSQFAPGVRTALSQFARVAEGSRHDDLAGYLERAEGLTNASTVRARSRFRWIVRLCREVSDRDPDSAPEMADLRVAYLDRRRAELCSLEQAVHEGDFAAIRKAGHNLKGTGTAYGFEEITEIGRSLEAAGKDGDTFAVETLLDQMDSYIEVVRAPQPQGR